MSERFLFVPVVCFKISRAMSLAQASSIRHLCSGRKVSWNKDRNREEKEYIENFTAKYLQYLEWPLSPSDQIWWRNSVVRRVKENWSGKKARRLPLVRLSEQKVLPDYKVSFKEDEWHRWSRQIWGNECRRDHIRVPPEGPQCNTWFSTRVTEW